MKKKLVLLENLQALDSAIDGKRASQNTLRAENSEHEQEISSFMQALEADLTQQADLERQKAELEVTLAAELENIKRSESHVKEIRTNKEFQAVGREISTARKQVSELEEQILALTSRIEEFQLSLDARRLEFDTLEEQNRSAISEKEAVIAVFQAEIDSASNNREEIIRQLSPNIVRRYHQLRDQRRGQALAVVQGGSCLGCNMQLPPQLYNTLFRGDEMIFCPHCQRILILRQEQAQ